MSGETATTVTGNVCPCSCTTSRCSPGFGSIPSGISVRSITATSSGRCGPYASSMGMVTVFRSPGRIPTIAASKPGITEPSPMVNSRGPDPLPLPAFPSEASKTVPSPSLPV